jgi:hypothetical protein
LNASAAGYGSGRGGLRIRFVDNDNVVDGVLPISGHFDQHRPGHHLLALARLAPWRTSTT